MRSGKAMPRLVAFICAIQTANTYYSYELVTCFGHTEREQLGWSGERDNREASRVWFVNLGWPVTAEPSGGC